MNKPLLLCLLAILGTTTAQAQDTATKKPDTVIAGIYITSIHNIDFKQKEFSVNFWLWLKYKNKNLNFYDNLEVPNAKEVTKSFVTTDTTNGMVSMQMKLQCVMKDSWRIENFPFDHQRLRIMIENSQFDSKSMVFVADTVGNHYDTRFTLRGWTVDSCNLTTGPRVYETGFGAEGVRRTEYSAFRVVMDVQRDALGLFWKLFLGMYIAFLIAYVCFYIHADGMDSRFGLSVGSLFAVIGNKYIIDSSLPESTSFTLVDTLHGVTLFSIFTVISCTAYSLKLVKSGKVKQAEKFDKVMAQVLLIFYLALNIWFISQASA